MISKVCFYFCLICKRIEYIDLLHNLKIKITYIRPKISRLTPVYIYNKVETVDELSEYHKFSFSAHLI